MNASGFQIELRHVGFSYDGGETWALDDVNLGIRAGERVCIVGANGVEEVLNPTLTESEQAKFHASCEHIRANIAQLAWWNDECHPTLRS